MIVFLKNGPYFTPNATKRSKVLGSKNSQRGLWFIIYYLLKFFLTEIENATSEKTPKKINHNSIYKKL